VSTTHCVFKNNDISLFTTIIVLYLCYENKHTYKVISNHVYLNNTSSGTKSKINSNYTYNSEKKIDLRDQEHSI